MSNARCDDFGRTPAAIDATAPEVTSALLASTTPTESPMFTKSLLSILSLLLLLPLALFRISLLDCTISAVIFLPSMATSFEKSNLSVSVFISKLCWFLVCFRSVINLLFRQQVNLNKTIIIDIFIQNAFMSVCGVWLREEMYEEAKTGKQKRNHGTARTTQHQKRPRCRCRRRRPSGNGNQVEHATQYPSFLFSSNSFFGRQRHELDIGRRRGRQTTHTQTAATMYAKRANEVRKQNGRTHTRNQCRPTDWRAYLAVRAEEKERVQTGDHRLRGTTGSRLPGT